MSEASEHVDEVKRQIHRCLRTVAKELKERNETGILPEGTVRNLSSYLVQNGVVTHFSEAPSIVNSLAFDEMATICSEPNKSYGLKRLKDGESRVFVYPLGVRVNAKRVDADTPEIGVGIRGQVIYMTDTDANDLIDGLHKALSILPTSK